MDNGDDPVGGGQAMLGHARRMYLGLSSELSEAIARLRRDPFDAAEAKARLELIRAHQKALQAVLDIEVGLGRRRGKGVGAVVGELDLDGAREEIRRRVARIRAGGGS